MLRNLLFLATLGLIVYAVADVVRSTDKERLNLHPAIWVVLIVLFPLVGSVAWLAVSRSQRNAASSGTGRSAANRRAPVAPDDDPEFLSRLDEERRRRDAGDGTPPPA